MKSKIIYSILFVLAAILPTSCDKDTEGMTFITYYPSLTLEGNSSVLVNVGETYEEEGYYAELDGEDVTDEVIVTSAVDYSTPGVYSITYTIYNVDGFSASSTRSVYVVDPDNVATLYWGECVTPSATYTDAVIYITDNGDGTYLLDDIMGGFYFSGVYPGYEPTYDFHAEVNFQINADNSITQVGEVGSWYFTSSVELGIANGSTYDPETGTITLYVTYNSYTLTVTLVKITEENFY